MKTKKIISAGPLVLEAIYPRGSAHDSPRIRAGKRRLSSEAQQRMNLKYSYQKLELMLAANFMPGDLIVTLTYDDAHAPASRAEADRRLKKFRADLSRRRARRGARLVMVWATENVFGAGRWHHHCVINASGADFEEIRRCWPGGSNVEIEKLRIDRDHSYECIARYMCKEARERPGLRSWSYTRSCRHPEVESFPVPDDTPLQPPKGATIYEEATERNDYGSFRWVKYLAPDWRRRKRPYSPRRRKR